MHSAATLRAVCTSLAAHVRFLLRFLETEVQRLCCLALKIYGPFFTFVYGVFSYHRVPLCVKSTSHFVRPQKGGYFYAVYFV